MTYEPQYNATRQPLDAPLYIIADLHDRLREAHAVNLALCEQIELLGGATHPIDGVATLKRLRNLENVLDLSRLLCRAIAQGDDLTTAVSALNTACKDAGRAP